MKKKFFTLLLLFILSVNYVCAQTVEIINQTENKVKIDSDNSSITIDNLSKKLITIPLPNNVDGVVVIKNGIIFYKNKKYGFIDKKGNITLDANYDIVFNPIYKEAQNYLILKKENNFAIYNIKSKKISDFKYDDAYQTKLSTVLAKNGTKKKNYNKLGGTYRKIQAKALQIGWNTFTLIGTGVICLSIVGIKTAPFFYYFCWNYYDGNPTWEEHPKPYFK